MRILFVTDFYHPYSGGVEIHVRTVAHELAARGHAVAVATLPTPAGVPAPTGDGPVAIYPVRHSAEILGARFNHQDRAWAPPFPDPVTGRGLRRVIADFEPDLIHGHDWLSRSALPGPVSGGLPVVTSLHYSTRTCAKKTLWRGGEICSGPELAKCLRCAGEHYGRVRGTVVTLGLRVGAALEDRRTERWVSVSAATERGNELDGRHNSVVVANPMPGPVGRRPPDTGVDAAGSQDLPVELPDGAFILFVGDIRPEKGVAVLAEAVAVLRAD
ncbi:MAG: glycosyltransferase, partial [Acidimicrobiales bacterium]